MRDAGQLAEPGSQTSKDQGRHMHGKPRMKNVMLNLTTANLTFDGKMLSTGENHNMRFMSTYHIACPCKHNT